jgi:hypothetical protein
MSALNGPRRVSRYDKTLWLSFMRCRGWPLDGIPSKLIREGRHCEEFLECGTISTPYSANEFGLIAIVHLVPERISTEFGP